MFERKKRRRFFYILLFLALFVFINKFVLSFNVLFRYTYSSILYPVFLSQKYAINPVKKFFEKKKNNKELRELVLSLKKDKDDLISDNIKLRSTASCYEKIKEIIDFKKRYKIEKLQLCQIIFKHINQNSHFLFVDKGSYHGVDNDVVIVYKNVLLGKVVETYPFYSKVLLVTDKSCKVASYCSKTGANGIHVGDNLSGQTLLNRVNHLSDVQKGDLVLSSGYGLVFPHGFALGKIKDAQNGDLYHTIKVEPLLDIKDIDYCFLIKKGRY